MAKFGSQLELNGQITVTTEIKACSRAGVCIFRHSKLPIIMFNIIGGVLTP